MKFTQKEKEQHLLKLANALVKAIDTDNNFGTPGIDPKRPFGDSNPDLDVPHIIGLEMPSSDGFTNEQYEYCAALLYEDVVPFLKKRCRLVLKDEP